jgi:hypothetical protein
MKITSAQITILIGRDETTIELHDKTSGRQILEIKLTPAQLSSALSRLSHTPCEASVYNLDKINKRQEIDMLEFEIIDDFGRQRDLEYLTDLAEKACPEGWEFDQYFQSQDSFFGKNGKRYARTTIRRWIEIPSKKTEVQK